MRGLNSIVVVVLVGLVAGCPTASSDAPAQRPGGVSRQMVLDACRVWNEGEDGFTHSLIFALETDKSGGESVGAASTSLLGACPDYCDSPDGIARYGSSSACLDQCVLCSSTALEFVYGS